MLKYVFTGIVFCDAPFEICYKNKVYQLTFLRNVIHILYIIKQILSEKRFVLFKIAYLYFHFLNTVIICV